VSDGQPLNGRIALVTGASRGLGRGIAIALAGAGADLIVNYREREDAAAAVCAEIAALGRRCSALRADVSRAPEAARLVETAQAEIGPIDILVNNAGIARPQPIPEITEGDWDAVVDTNLKSAFLLTQAVLPHMRAQRWGRIVNLSSVAAQLGGVIGPHYAASKAGMIGLTHAYASLLADEGITVNAIAPALIETDMIAALPRTRMHLIPVGRFGTPEEIAGVVLMLADNGYITGQTISVNGGWYMT
jgi:3-oxoacyl-[acyl-carrier protein] reductase